MYKDIVVSILTFTLILPFIQSLQNHQSINIKALGLLRSFDTILLQAHSSSQVPSSSQASTMNSLHNKQSRPWYSHPDLDRDRAHVSQIDGLSEAFWKDQITNKSDTSRFILMSPHGMLYQSRDSPSKAALPHYLTASKLRGMIGARRKNGNDDFDDKNIVNGADKKGRQPFLAWVGKYKEIDYWITYMEDFDIDSIISTKSFLGDMTLHCKPLREFGDTLEEELDAAILATAQGLIEFHKSHSFCSSCGGSTYLAKAGGCRKCHQCQRSVYPRLDVAAIMLITSPCRQYALLGRKASWPKGRYSTLAGFCEVGETLEDCCRRETFEESGVIVDPSTVQFIASQPWPFPRSLMVGFRAKATTQSEHILPKIHVDRTEMEDVQWFAKDFVKQRLCGGSTALSFEPSESESIFHVPGKASLAHFLIIQWVKEE